MDMHMTEDPLFQWWFEHKFERFCDYMKAWATHIIGLSNKVEKHSDPKVRLNRAINYIDMRTEKDGFIKKYLVFEYGIEFVEHITTAYWQIAESEKW